MSRYLAFISYRHIKPDQHVSALLRRYLENYHPPASCGLPSRRRVFRDTDELPTSTDLGADIEHALDESEYLIALCSEEYCKSKWCMREIDSFIEMGRKPRILPVLVSGEKETSVPESIRDLPVVLDLRNASNHEVHDHICELFQYISGVEASVIAASDRKHRILTRGGIFAGLAAILAGVVFYALSSSWRISANNQAIIDATEEAILEEENAITQIEDYSLKKRTFLSRRAWTEIEQGNDREAVELASSALLEPVDFLQDKGIFLPDSVEAVDALRMALAMPHHQTSQYYPYEEAYTPFTIEDYYLRTSKLSLDFAPDRKEIVIEGPPSDPYLYVFSPFEEDNEYGELAQEYNAKYEKALEAGYRHVVFQEKEILAMYGEGKALSIKDASQTEPAVKTRHSEKDEEAVYIDYVLHGKPFQAEQIWYSPGPMDFVAAYDGRQTVLFHRGVPEAVAVLPVKGLPQCVAFNKNTQQMAIVDSEGTLALFLTEDGNICQTLEGTYQYVNYGNDNYRFCAVTSEGEVRRIHAITLETDLVFQSPLPVQAVTYCAQRDLWLAQCDHYVILLDGSTGAYVSSHFCWRTAIACVWEDYDDVGFRHTGDGFYVISKDEIDLFRIETDGENAAFVRLANEDVTGAAHTAFYSPDSESLYLQYENGDLARWDINWSDPFEWVSDANRWMAPDYYPEFCLSNDGSVLWGDAEDGHGIRKIDAVTGWLCYGEYWSDSCDGSDARECSVMDYAIAPASREGQKMVCFDPTNGEEYWSLDVLGKAIFSPYEILNLQIQESPAGDGRSVVFRRIDLDGYIWEKITLGQLDPEEAGDIVMDEETLTAVIDDTWLVDLDAVTIERKAPSPKTPLIFAGQEVQTSEIEGRTYLVNAEDGHRLIDAGNHKMLIAPDGESLLLYGEGFTPIVIFASDQDSLLDDAYWKYDSGEEIDWEEELYYIEQAKADEAEWEEMEWADVEDDED